jgi:hypothetical protein
MLIKEERKAIWTWSSIRIGVKNSFFDFLLRERGLQGGILF